MIPLWHKTLGYGLSTRHKCGSAKSKYILLDIAHPPCIDDTNISFTQKNRGKIPNNINKTTITVKASFGIGDSPVNRENTVQTFIIRKVIMVHQWQYLKLWLIAKTNSTVIIMCLKIFVLRSDISYLNWPPVFSWFELLCI